LLLIFFLLANGDGSREPSQKELEIARTQGENFAKLLNTFHRGAALSIEDKKEDDVIENNTAATQEEPKVTAAPVKEAPKPVVEEKKPAPTTTAAAKPRSASKREDKDSKCFCM
jgi:hypothetical protein